MRRATTLLFAVFLLTLAAAPVSAASKSPFVGAWTGIDINGSTEALTVSSGTDVRVTLIDLGGSICANNGSPTAVFTGSLTGTVAGDTLSATWDRARCGPVSFDVSGWDPGRWTYDATTDRLFDGYVYWNRRS